MMQTLKREQWPDRLRDLLKAQGYRKHYCFVSVHESVELIQPYWGGGSKESFWTCDLFGGNAGHIVFTEPGGWPKPPARQTFPLVHGRVLIAGGISCGKPDCFHLHMCATSAKELGLLA